MLNTSSGSVKENASRVEPSYPSEDGVSAGLYAQIIAIWSLFDK